MKEEQKNWKNHPEFFDGIVTSSGWINPEPKSVLAKFKCDTLMVDAYNTNASLTAVTTGSEENKSFAKFTPSASLNMTISKDTEAYNFFEPGKEYYITITEE